MTWTPEIKPAEDILRISRAQALRMSRRFPHSINYDVDDMSQDAAVAMLQGKLAKWGIITGLRKWLSIDTKLGPNSFRLQPFSLDGSPCLVEPNTEPEQEAIVYVHELQVMGYSPECVSEIHKYVWCWTEV